MAEEALKGSIESPSAERFLPAQFNLFTGAAEPVPVEVSEPEELGREIRVDEGITLVLIGNHFSTHRCPRYPPG